MGRDSNGLAVVRPHGLSLERGVGPHAEVLARRLQAAAYSHGYEDASPANATTRQAKTHAVRRNEALPTCSFFCELAEQAYAA
jgi:hypothetical protein